MNEGQQAAKARQAIKDSLNGLEGKKILLKDQEEEAGLGRDAKEEEKVKTEPTEDEECTMIAQKMDELTPLQLRQKNLKLLMA